MRKNIIFLLLIMITMTGCETVKGLAKDVANTGNNIQEISAGAPEFKK